MALQLFIIIVLLLFLAKLFNVVKGVLSTILLYMVIVGVWVWWSGDYTQGEFMSTVVYRAIGLWGYIYHQVGLVIRDIVKGFVDLTVGQPVGLSRLL